jgi:putative membrane protein
MYLLEVKFRIMEISKIKALIFILLLLTFILCLSSCRNKNGNKEIAEQVSNKKFERSGLEKDTDFAVTVAEGGMLEIKLGQLAQSKASSEKIRTLGQLMIADHVKTTAELKMLARQKNIKVPEKLDKANQDRYNDLAKKKGKDFDKAYAQFTVWDHKDAIDNFKKESDRGSDTDLKSWASGKISVLERHLEMAKQAEDFAKKM